MAGDNNRLYFKNYERRPDDEEFAEVMKILKEEGAIISDKYIVNIPDEIPSAVRRYGNHFLASLLCIPKYNFYENISKGCYAPQMRQGLD